MSLLPRFKLHAGDGFDLRDFRDAEEDGPLDYNDLKDPRAFAKVKLLGDFVAAKIAAKGGDASKVEDPYGIDGDPMYMEFLVRAPPGKVVGFLMLHDLRIAGAKDGVVILEASAFLSTFNDEIRAKVVAGLADLKVETKGKNDPNLEITFRKPLRV